MNEQTIPELQRVPLPEVCMQVLSASANRGGEEGKKGVDCAEFLSHAPQPPKREQVDAAIDMLESVGAVERGEGAHAAAQHLTPLGFHLSKLGVDVRVGKILLYSCMFGCLEKGLTIAAVLATGKSVS